MSEVGELHLYRQPPMGDLYIKRADPRIVISVEILEEIQQGMEWGDGFEASVRDGVVRIEAVNRTVVYQLGEKVPGRLVYYAEWPD